MYSFKEGPFTYYNNMSSSTFALKSQTVVRSVIYKYVDQYVLWPKTTYKKMFNLMIEEYKLRMESLKTDLDLSKKLKNRPT